MVEMKIIDQKVFQPIALYTSMVISIILFTNSDIFTFIMYGLLVAAACRMGFNILVIENSSLRFRNSLIELTYCISIYLISMIVNKYMGNIISSLAIILIFTIYILRINPLVMQRHIITKKDYS